MSEMKYAHELALQIEEQCAAAQGKYMLNRNNMEKFGKVYNFFCELAEDEDGELSFGISPEVPHGEVSVRVESVDLRQDGMKQFVDILRYVDKLDVKAASLDDLLICAYVKDIWEVIE